MPHARILALHGLLGIYETLLQNRNRAQIAPDGDNAAIGSERHREVADRHVAALGRMIDLPPARRRLSRLGVGQQLFDLGAALQGDGIDPRLADPLVVAFLRYLVGTE